MSWGVQYVESSPNSNLKLNAEERAEYGGFIPLNYACSALLNKYTLNPGKKSKYSQRDLKFDKFDVLWSLHVPPAVKLKKL